jgi:hypothetical protein
MRCTGCGGRTRRVKTKATREGFRQTRACACCGTRIFLRGVIERIEHPEPPAIGFAAGSSLPVDAE